MSTKHQKLFKFQLAFFMIFFMCSSSSQSININNNNNKQILHTKKKATNQDNGLTSMSYSGLLSSKNENEEENKSDDDDSNENELGSSGLDTNENLDSEDFDKFRSSGLPFFLKEPENEYIIKKRPAELKCSTTHALEVC